MALPSPKDILDSSFFIDRSELLQAQQRKEQFQNRKQMFMLKGSESYRFNKLVRNCASKFGPESTLEVFGRIGRETGMKDYNALIKLCISKARQGNAEDASVQINRIYQLFISMRERGFQIEEQTFGPFLEYMIDMKNVHEFQIFSELIKDTNPKSHSRMGYYEMLLWIRVGNEDKIRELCNLSGVVSDEDCYNLAGMRFCTSGLLILFYFPFSPC